MPSKKPTKKDGSWKHARRIAWRKVADEAVILDVESAVYYSLNGAGLRMWELLGQGRGASAIAAAVASEYAVAEVQALADLKRLVDQLGKEKLIEKA